MTIDESPVLIKIFIRFNPFVSHSSAISALREVFSFTSSARGSTFGSLPSRRSRSWTKIMIVPRQE